MAIIQISRIQLRKGLQQDLPQLASAEMAWSIDSRQLYIGNGTISEGAPVEGITEVLTQYSDILNIGNQYIFRGAQSGYTSQTGPTALTPVAQTIQTRLDEIVSVRDFGALGNGSTDDTAAIQRAIDQILFGGFAISQPRLRRVIHFPPGTYIINGSIALPSYVRLVGSGKDRTIIQQASSAVIFQLKDNSGQVGNAYGSNGAQFVIQASIEHMTLYQTQSKNAVTLDACTQVEFLNVNFTGSQNNANSTSYAGQNAVVAVPNNSSASLSGLNFIDCGFSNFVQGLILNAQDVKILGCNFANMSTAIVVDITNSAAITKNIKIANCTFDQIARSATNVYASSTSVVTNVTSIGNSYGEVGTGYVGAGHPVYPVVNFTCSGNYSVSDSFTRTDQDAATISRVFHASGALNLSIQANSGVRSGMTTRGPGRTITLAASVTNANTGVVLNGSVDGSAVIDYVLRSGSPVSAWRQGSIKVLYNTTTTSQYTDEYTEFPDPSLFNYNDSSGVSFKVNSLGAGKYALTYDSSNSGTSVFIYNVTNIHL